MKSFFTFCLVLLWGVCLGQNNPCQGAILQGTYTFDYVPGTYNSGVILRDSLSDPSNLWQIGKPHKSVISSPVSPPNIIITDTSKSYPPNDTASFRFIFSDAQGGFSSQYAKADFAGYYQVQTDSLNDYGKMEYSLDTGRHWIDLLNDSISAGWWYTPKPVLTGNSGGWKFFAINLSGSNKYFNVKSNGSSRVHFRFTFISDSIIDTLDGLAFDQFTFCDLVEDVQQIQANALLHLYPNPVTDILHSERRGALSKGQLQIMDAMGKMVFEDRNFTAPTISTKALGLPAGLYFARFTSGEAYAVQKFLVAP